MYTLTIYEINSWCSIHHKVFTFDTYLYIATWDTCRHVGTATPFVYSDTFLCWDFTLVLPIKHAMQITFNLQKHTQYMYQMFQILNDTHLDLFLNPYMLFTHFQFRIFLSLFSMNCKNSMSCNFNEFVNPVFIR